jgi:hypothetical protein
MRPSATPPASGPAAAPARPAVMAILRRPSVIVFAFVCLVAAIFALYTDHVWEDYYITYRASKNLATGEGLVHNPGQRVHSFTSPLGVLLPSAASLATLNRSDVAALWIFRALAIGALAAAAVLLYRCTQRLGLSLAAAGFLVVCLATDTKTVDFTINGMETPFLILFFAYAFWAMLSAGPRRWVHLGLAWGGLMWSRPDACIPIALLTITVWGFNDAALTGLSRREWLPELARAAGVATAVYLPWFLFAWSYYGSPVPHTVTAKSLLAGAKTLEGFWLSLLAFTQRINSPYAAIDSMFAPPNMVYGGWPDGPRLVMRTVAAICAGLWLVRWLHPLTRALSLTYLGLCVYLNYFPPFPFAWYLTLPSTVALLVLACTFSQLLARARAAAPRWRGALQAAVLLPMVGFAAIGGWYTWHAAHQLKAQQAIIENGVRRPIGEWLRANAAAGDTVFLEPLGYIGYFSGLRTYDYPGLSSPEMVAAVRRHGTKRYAPLIRELNPGWLVLRPAEMADIHKEDPDLLRKLYAPAKAFDRRRDVEQLKVYGLGYLEYDAAFMVFKRR